MKFNKLLNKLIACCFCLSPLTAQTIFSDENSNEIEFSTNKYIIPKSFRTLSVVNDQLELSLSKAPLESDVNVHKSQQIISLPFPDGSSVNFRFVESPIMSLVLSKKYPMIKTYLGESADKQGMTVRFDYSPDYGFHAMVLGATDAVFIDPFSLHNTQHIISYYRKDFMENNQKEFEELAPIQSEDYKEFLEFQSENPIEVGQEKSSSGEELRTYRTAIACTGEYANFHGGTTSSVLAGIVTTMNRVNEVYENEVAIRLVLVDNNDQIIYLSSSSDPFSNYSTGTLINESQVVIDEIIGTDNYDIGHTFSTGAGGLASLGVPCKSGQKASAATGTNTPIGDPYDIDYVAHEIGHQFGANHTFNGNSGACSGNRNEDTAYEPGSGSTILAYAGICGSNNLQSFSDPYFHASSFDEIRQYSTYYSGNSCAVITETGNTAPVVILDDDIYSIPMYTAFTLNASAVDIDSNNLTYCWEQMDLGPAGSPNSPATGNAPIFRSFEPSLESARTFPKLSSIINNTTVKGEEYPSYIRNLHFRLSVRDNSAGGGGLSYEEVGVNVTEQAGPFEVLKPNGTETWGLGGTYEIEWEVADTDNNLVNCQEVNILLSLDGGLSYPIILAEGVPNYGDAEIVVPNDDSMLGSEARIKIEASENIFFDISNDDFSITGMSITEISGGNWELFPNPNQGVFTIRLQDIKQDLLNLNIYDLSGKLIHKEVLENNSGSMERQINLTKLNKGLYFIELGSPTERKTQSISIQ